MRAWLGIAQSQSPCSITIPAVHVNEPGDHSFPPQPRLGRESILSPQPCVKTLQKFWSSFSRKINRRGTFLPPPPARIKFLCGFFVQPCDFSEEIYVNVGRGRRKLKGLFQDFSNWLCQPRPWSDIPGTYLCVPPGRSSTGRAERWVRTPSRSGPPSRTGSSRWGAVIPWERSGIPLRPNSGKEKAWFSLSQP